MVHRIDPERRQWKEPSSQSLENDLRAMIRALAKDSAKLGSMKRDTTEYRRQRALLAAAWERIDPALSQLQSQVARESKRSVHDAIHAKLCRIEREASTDPAHLSKPWIHWKAAIDKVIQWLDEY